MHLVYHHHSSSIIIGNRGGGIGNGAIRTGGASGAGAGGNLFGYRHGTGTGRTTTSYVLHSLSLCEALTHRLARHTNPCLGNGFAAVFAVRRTGGVDKGGAGVGASSITTGLSRRNSSGVDNNQDNDDDDNDDDEDVDVFSVTGGLSSSSSHQHQHSGGNEAATKNTTTAGGAGGHVVSIPVLPVAAVAGVVASITQSWRIMRRLVAEVGTLVRGYGKGRVG